MELEPTPKAISAHEFVTALVVEITPSLHRVTPDTFIHDTDNVIYVDFEPKPPEDLVA